jgi:hypothetical protein
LREKEGKGREERKKHISAHASINPVYAFG